MSAAASRTLLAAALLVVALASGSAQAAARAWLDRDTVTLGETVTLNVESDDASAAPDFSVLAGDFELLGTSSGTQVRHDGSGRSVVALRAVALRPRRAGSFTIPPLQVGNETTEALTVTVLPPQADPAADRDVFLEVELEPRDPYVQQQVRYTLRLYYAVTLLEGQLEEPSAEHVQVRRLGQDRSDQRVIDGRRYNVVERHYALIPERSGALQIVPAVFRGRAILPGRRSTWIGAGAAVSAQGEAITLQVKPRPRAASEPWLPAAELVLEDVSGSLPESIRIGEPLTLTLRARARGLGAAQLPELVLPPIEGADVYPDQAVTRDGNEGAWLIGERERKFAIVPHAPGTLRLPAVEIRWWDTDTAQVRTARVDGREFTVLPAAGSSAPAAPSGSATAAADGATTAPAPPAAGRWPWLAGLFALLWLLTLGWAVLLRRRRAQAATAPARQEAPQLRRARAQLRDALQRGDLAAIAQALRTLASAEGKPVLSLGELAGSLASQGQRDALQAIENARYGDADSDAACAAARREFAAARLQWQHAPAPAAGSPLPPLYPGG